MLFDVYYQSTKLRKIIDKESFFPIIRHYSQTILTCWLNYNKAHQACPKAPNLKFQIGWNFCLLEKTIAIQRKYAKSRLNDDSTFVGKPDAPPKKRKVGNVDKKVANPFGLTTFILVGCGENRIRTCEPVLPVTRFPGVPLQPLEHLSLVVKQFAFRKSECKGTKKDE